MRASRKRTRLKKLDVNMLVAITPPWKSAKGKASASGSRTTIKQSAVDVEV